MKILTSDGVMRRYDPRAARRLREAIRPELTIAEVAKLVRVAPQTLRYLERGVTVPRADTLAKLAQLYGVDIGCFFVQKKAAA